MTLETSVYMSGVKIVERRAGLFGEHEAEGAVYDILIGRTVF